MKRKTEITTLGGGCFWCLEAVYDDLEGVLDVVSGYAGGHMPDPDYNSVCKGISGHAEVVQVTFDPQVISYQEILEIFFSVHDPTSLNRQGNDIGTQYRSVIFYHSEKQKETAEEVMAGLQADAIWPDPIVTQLEPLGIFYPAEDYHQEYFKRNPYQGYCQVIIAPKLVKFRQKYIGRLKS